MNDRELTQERSLCLDRTPRKAHRVTPACASRRSFVSCLSTAATIATVGLVEQRSRRKLRAISPVHPIGTPTVGVSFNTGPLASAAWLISRDLTPSHPRWFVEVAFHPGSATSFKIEIYSEEWGFVFSHAARESWIRVTDVPFVHGRDDHRLLRMTPRLSDLGALIRSLEERYEIGLSREHAQIATNLVDAEPNIRDWVKSL